MRSAASWSSSSPVGVERDGEIGRAPVAGHERLRAGVGEAVHLRYVAVCFEPAAERLDALAPRGGARVDALDQHDHAGLAEAGPLEALVGDDALGVGIVGAVGIEAIGHAATQHARHDEEDGGHGEHPARAAIGEACEAVHHRGAPPAARPRGRTSQPSTRWTRCRSAAPGR